MKDREQAGFEESGFEATGFAAAEFDAGLADAMQRVDAPQTLERFLMLAVDTEAQRRKAGDDRQVNLATQASLTQALPSSRGRLLAMASPQNWWAGAAAAMLLMGCTLGGLHVQHERAQAQATAEFELSERITDQALEQTRKQLQQAGISLGQ